jgi:uncharacterized protein (TIGR02001 family)
MKKIIKKTFKKIIITTIAVVTPLAPFTVIAADMNDTEKEHDLLGGDFTGWVEFANERMFRGNSETQNSEVPSIQGMVTWTHADTGWYAGYWMATVKFDAVPGLNGESAPYIGKFGTIGDTGINYNVSLWHYIYHKGSNVGDTLYAYQPNYTELWITANKNVTENLNIYAEFVPTLDAWFGTKKGDGGGPPAYDNGSDVRGYEFAITPTYQLGDGWSVNATIGRQMFTDPQFVGVGNWTYGNIGVAKVLRDNWKLALSYHTTNVDDDKDTFDIYKDHVVASVSKSF